MYADGVEAIKTLSNFVWDISESKKNAVFMVQINYTKQYLFHAKSSWNTRAKFINNK